MITSPNWYASGTAKRCGVAESIKPSWITNELIGRQIGEVDAMVEEKFYKDNSLEQFFANVRASLEAHAELKGYNDTGADGRNILFEFTTKYGISNGHAMGEIIYKAVEYIKNPRKVLLEKIAGWAFMAWKHNEHQAEDGRKP